MQSARANQGRSKLLALTWPDPVRDCRMQITVKHAGASHPRDTQCNGHWRRALQVGPQGRHWALGCQPKGWHWKALGIGVPAERLALDGIGHSNASVQSDTGH